MGFLHYILVQVPAKLGWMLLCAALVVLMFAGCAETKYHRIFINGKPHSIKADSNIIYRENGRLVPMRIEE